MRLYDEQNERKLRAPAPVPLFPCWRNWGPEEIRLEGSAWNPGSGFIPPTQLCVRKTEAEAAGGSPAAGWEDLSSPVPGGHGRWPKAHLDEVPPPVRPPRAQPAAPDGTPAQPWAHTAGGCALPHTQDLPRPSPSPSPLRQLQDATA